MEDWIQAKDKLQVTAGSGGSQTRIDGPGGILELSVGANEGRSLETVSKFVRLQNYPNFGGRIRLDATFKVYFYVGLAIFPVSSSPHLAGIYVDATLTNWQGLTRVSPNGKLQDLGIPKATSEIVFTAFATPTSLKFTINGALVGSITQYLPSGELKFGVEFDTTDTSAKKVLLDNVWLTATR